MKNFDNLLNSDFMNQLIDRKMKCFSLFLVKHDKNSYSLYFNDKDFGTEICIANFKSYSQYLRWFTEAAIMRVAAKPEDVRKVRQIYKKLYAFSRDPERKDEFRQIF